MKSALKNSDQAADLTEVQLTGKIEKKNKKLKKRSFK